MFENILEDYTYNVRQAASTSASIVQQQNKRQKRECESEQN